MLAVIVAVCSSPGWAGNRIALVIGNSNYQNTPPLQNPRYDAPAVAKALKGIGFDPVDLHVDVTFAAMRQALSEFNTKASSADVALVFFAGHGMEFGGKNFLLPIDARLRSEADIEWELIPLDRVLSAARPSKLQIVILDSCRNNPLAPAMATDEVQGARGLQRVDKHTTSRGFARVDPDGNVAIAYAAKHGSVALDGDGENSPFTLALLDNLSTPGLDVRLMFGRVRDGVISRTNGAQEPFLYGALGGQELFLVPKPASAGDEKEQQFWANIKDSDAKEVFALYLQLYPDGPNAAAARERLAALSGGTVPAAPARPPLTGEIKIAVAGPMSGPSGVFGAQFRSGASAAVAAINAQGGVLGRRLVLISGDDASDPKTAVQVANMFVGEGVPFVVGHFNSGTTIPASDVYEENGVIAISPSATNPLVTSRGRRFLFRLSDRDDKQGDYAGNYLARYFGDKRIAVVHDDTPYGKTTADAAALAMERLDKPPVLRDSYKSGQKNFADLIKKLKTANVEVLYVGGVYFEAAKIVRQLRAARMNTLLVSGEGLDTSEFWQLAGPAAEGTLMTSLHDARRRLEASAVVRQMRAGGVEPEGYTLFAYAAVQTWAEAANRAGTTEAAKVAETIATKRFTTVLGTLGFDSQGDITVPSSAFYRWSKGSYAPIDLN